MHSLPRAPTVGIIGGGQLARMLALAGTAMGLRFRVLDPALDACAATLAEPIVAAYDDLAELHRFAGTCDVISFDFENVSAAALAALAEERPVRPNPESLRTSQDRALEKALFQRLSIPVGDYAVIDTLADLQVAMASMDAPAVLKTRRLGYDGKGQCRIKPGDDLAAAFDALGGVPCVLERLLAFERELSIVAVRGLDGAMAFYPLTENIHAHGILAVSIAPAEVEGTLTSQAQQYARRLAESLDYVGCFAIEFFVVDGRLLANEMAPRVHNSGHWTMDGATTSQFENHLRAILGWPLGSTSARGISVMLNWVGALPPVAPALAIPGLHWHDYGKAPRAGRKLGHANIVAERRADLIERLRLAEQYLGCAAQVQAALARLG